MRIVGRGTRCLARFPYELAYALARGFRRFHEQLVRSVINVQCGRNRSTRSVFKAVSFKKCGEYLYE
jgi:hypothetical protein